MASALCPTTPAPSPRRLPSTLPIVTMFHALVSPTACQLGYTDTTTHTTSTALLSCHPLISHGTRPDGECMITYLINISKEIRFMKRKITSNIKTMRSFGCLRALCIKENQSPRTTPRHAGSNLHQIDCIIPVQG